MARTTENMRLNIFDSEDIVDFEKLNENFEKLDNVSPNININGKTPDSTGTISLLPADIQITSGTASLTAGTSTLPSGGFYFQYE